MTGLIPAADPLGLPVPVWIMMALKIFGFFLHLLFMNLWVAGLPTALFLLRKKPAVAVVGERCSRAFWKGLNREVGFS